MVDGSARSEVESILAALAVQYSAPGEGADNETWQAWIQLDELDSSIAGVLSRVKFGESPSSHQMTNRWRSALRDEELWQGRWASRRATLVAACDLLDSRPGRESGSGVKPDYAPPGAEIGG